MTASRDGECRLDLAETYGYVRRPVCGDCEGDGIDMAWPDDPGTEPHPCPSCDGSGFAKLVVPK